MALSLPFVSGFQGSSGVFAVLGVDVVVLITFNVELLVIKVEFVCSMEWGGGASPFSCQAQLSQIKLMLC